MTGAPPIRFLSPGEYEVSVDDLDTDPASRNVEVGEAEDVTGGDFTEVSSGR